MSNRILKINCLPPALESLYNFDISNLGNNKFNHFVLCRLNLAFTYYGIVLMTTELYQGLNEAGGKCQGKKESEMNTITTMQDEQ